MEKSFSKLTEAWSKEVRHWAVASGLKQLRKSFVLSLLLLTAAHASAGPAYPLKGSTNGRYLVDQNDVPFLIIGDAPHSLLVNTTTADAEFYFSNRAKNGMNTLWVELLSTTYVNGRQDGSMLDGTLPFTGTLPGGAYDLTTPNGNYFAQVDRIVQMAAVHGIQVLLDSLETGDWTTVAVANGAARCRTYGQYLGNRYKDFANIIWITGNDFQTWRTPADDAAVTAVALGIKDRDLNHLQTVQLDYFVSESLDDPNWWPIVSLNSVYSYYPSYAETLNAYNRSNFVPVYFLEANYEYQNIGGEFGTPNVLRRQEYWSLLSGSNGGHMYGNRWTWTFDSGWKDYLESPGVNQLRYAKVFFESSRWYDLVPDQTHEVVTSGYGTFATAGNVSDSDYATAARTSDGSLALCYLPTIRTVSVNMTKMAGTTSARWFDPSDATYTAIAGSPFPNTGTRNFIPVGNNHDGEGDWVLVLEAQPLAGNDTISRRPGQSVKVSIAELLSNDSDVYGDALSLTLPGATSVKGGSVAIEGGWVIYSAPVSDAPDSFTYTVSDLHEGSTTGTIWVLVEPDENQSKNVLAILPDGSDFVISFAGIPGISYTIQYSESLSPAKWLDLGGVSAGANGQFEFRDVNPGSSSRYYRTFAP
jgi:hypothetical protein